MSAAKRPSVKDRSPLDELFTRREQIEGEEKPTAEATAEKAQEAKGKPPAQKKPGQLRQTTIMLYDRQLDWLDQMCIEARRDGGKPIRKAVLIRSLLDLAIDAPVDLRGLTNEHQLVERFEEAIKSK